MGGGHCSSELQTRILGVYPIEYATKQGLSQLIERAEDVLSGAERRRKRKATASVSGLIKQRASSLHVAVRTPATGVADRIEEQPCIGS